MSENKDHSTMGLPRVSGKRRWSADEEDDSDVLRPSPKAICTSPPYAVCAEDVLPNGPLPRPDPSSSPSPPPTMTTTDAVESSTQVEQYGEGSAEDLGEDAEDDSFLDDEDKDSGFIDGNSIDNSDEDEESGSYLKMDSSSASSGSSCDEFKSATPHKTDLQISLAKILPVSSYSSQTTTSLSISSSSDPDTNCVPLSIEPSTPGSAKSPLDDQSVISDDNKVDVPLDQAMDITSTHFSHQCYQTPSTNSSLIPTSYSSDLYENRPCNSSWSCTFYDGCQPSSTNKYMEISPSRISLTTQSIQCDENGKSYLELGGAAPYTASYNNECGSFNSAQSNYNSISYSQNFTGPSNPSPSFPSNTGYFTSRPNPPSTPPPFLYHRSADSYSGYEAENSAYSYSGSSYSQPNARTLGAPLSRIPSQRCTSPVCDLTKTSPRPPCYHQQRLSMLNMSMFKLNRFSRFPEPSLLRSVLICNTLRHIEKEMEREGLNMAAILSHSNAYAPPGHSVVGVSSNGAQSIDTMPSPPMTSTEGPLPSIHSPLMTSPVHSSPHPPSMSPASPPSVNPYNALDAPPPCYSPYPHDDSRDSSMPFDSLSRDSYSLRSDSPQPPSPDRVLLAESVADETEESTSGSLLSRNISDDRIDGINWCSVLSLSSQPDLDTINNNECQDWAPERDNSLTPLTSTTTLTTLTTRSLGKSRSDCTTTTSLSESTSSPHRDEGPGWRLPSLSAEDVLKSFHEAPRKSEEDLDTMINVLVSS